MDFALQLIEILEGPDARKAVEDVGEKLCLYPVAA
jgi:hypothetical protein